MIDVLTVVASELSLRCGHIFEGASALGWSVARGIKEVVLPQGSASKSRGVSCGIFIGAALIAIRASEPNLLG